MTSKDRGRLRAMANGLQPVFQSGKGGVTDELIKQTRAALEARELIKIKVLLETTPEPPRQIADKLAEATGSDVVQVIGGSMVFYKENPDLHKEKKPVKKVVKKSVKPAAKKVTARFSRRDSETAGQRKPRAGAKPQRGASK
jgi:RNA-binding protein